MPDLFSQPFEEDDEPAAAPGTERPARPTRRIVTVSELNASIRALLESGFGDIWVEGEVSNCRHWNTGHLFFTLKDGASQIRAVMYRSAVRYLKFTVEDGQHLIARGRLALYEPKGEYQLLCDHLQPHGLGALQLAFDQLKKKLEAEGLFDRSRKRPLPALPRKIGIVTSLEGAALHDIIKVLTRRHPNVHLVIRPTKVQGDGAAAEIADAVRSIGRIDGVDVVIVGRGGGSAEDLLPFNQEPVARAISNSRVPIVTAVGHETDFTIADFVSDVRAPTPSAAAEMVVSAHEEFRVRIDRQTRRLRAAVASRLALRGRHVAELTHQLQGYMSAAVARRERQFRGLRLRLEAADLRRRFLAMRGKLAIADRRLEAAMVRRHERARARLGASAARLESLSPLAVLGRGYAVCWNAERTAIIRNAATMAPGDNVVVTLEQGELACEVTAVDADGRQQSR
jgi:exodeoxyribonuclease VII large subunit